MSQDILIVIEDGVFSHGHSHTDVNIYVVDIDDNASDPVLSACYNPDEDSQRSVPLSEIDEKFGTEYEGSL